MISGLLVVDKATGMTSHDVVARCRRIVKQKRVGHAGTLDPGATGVLLVGLGNATRLMRFVGELKKSYVGEVVLGSTTSTLDDEGETTAKFDMSHVSLADVQLAAKKFVGDIEQIPPMVSAVKVNGRRLHELAREGIEVERKPRPVTVYDMDIDATDEPHVFKISVQCSSGTYIRTLAADIGAELGGGAHLRRLRRTAIGSFTADDALTLQQVENDLPVAVMTSAQMVGHLPRLVANEEVTQMIGFGRPVGIDSLGVPLPAGSQFAMLNEAADLLAVYELSGTVLRPSVVLPTE